MSMWLTILGMGLVTFATRAAGLLLTRVTIPPWALRWLSYVPVAMFTALAIPALLLQSSTPLTLNVPAAIAGLAGALAAWRGGGVVLTIIIGLVVFWGVRWLGG